MTPTWSVKNVAVGNCCKRKDLRHVYCRVPARRGLRRIALASGSDETRTRDPLVRQQVDWTRHRWGAFNLLNKILYKLESKPPPESKPLLESKPPYNVFLMGKSVIETLFSKVSPGLTIQIIQFLNSPAAHGGRSLPVGWVYWLNGSTF